jgi:hypothetical protein
LFQVFGRLICIEYIECMFREDVNWFLIQQAILEESKSTYTYFRTGRINPAFSVCAPFEHSTCTRGNWPIEYQYFPRFYLNRFTVVLGQIITPLRIYHSRKITRTISVVGSRGRPES